MIKTRDDDLKMQNIQYNKFFFPTTHVPVSNHFSVDFRVVPVSLIQKVPKTKYCTTVGRLVKVYTVD